ncbi:hypothetical protein ACSBR1_009092 [Camellia fascicularis]
MTGEYATLVANEMGLQIRSLCPLKDVTLWLNIDETTKATIIQAVLIVNKKAYTLYKDWRCNLKHEFELLEEKGVDDLYAHPPRGVSLDALKHLIDVAWQDAPHQKRSKGGKSNRSQLPYNHTSGSCSFPITPTKL